MIIDSFVRIRPSFRGDGKTVDEYRKVMNEFGIDKAVLVPNKGLDYNPIKGTEYVSKVVEGEPERFYGAVRIDPWLWKEKKDDFIDLFNNKNMRLIFLSPWEDTFRCNNEIVWPIYEYAGKHGIPVIIEAGYPIVSHITMVAQMADRFPETRFILTDSGQHDLSGCTEYDVTTALKEHDNIYIGTTTCINAAWLADMAKDVAAGRVLYQSDYPKYDYYLELFRVTNGYWDDEIKTQVLGKSFLELIDTAL